MCFIIGQLIQKINKHSWKMTSILQLPVFGGHEAGEGSDDPTC